NLVAAVPLQYSIPASVAALAYLNGRWRLGSDLKNLYSFIITQVIGNIREKKDAVNLFYKFEEHAKTSPDRVFLIYNGKSFTYKESYERVLRYGTWLKTKFGIQKNNVVAIDFMNSDTFIWLWFGLWSIGAKPAFINYNLMGTPLLHSVKASGTAILIVEDEVWGTLDDETKAGLQAANFREDGGALQVLPFTSSVALEIDNIIGKREPNEARSGQKLNNMAILIYTSGTTGLPKPAVVSWGKVGVSPDLVRRWLGLSPEDIFYTCMPLYHSSAAVLGVGGVLAAGCAISIGRKFHRQGFWDDCRASKATVIQYVGETCRYLMSLPPSAQDKNHNVRMAFGNGLRPDVWPAFKERFGVQTVAEFYAATEGPSALFNLSNNSFSEGSVGVSGAVIGTLLGGTSVVVDMDFDENKPVRNAQGFCTKSKPNSPGELLFKLDETDIEKNFQGYYKNKGATSSKVLRNVLVKGDAYFSTGDVLRRDHEGRWYFCDRIGDTFRWKSENVSTAEVAEVLGQKSKLLEETNVYGVLVPGHDGRAGCAAVVLSPEQQAKFQASGAVDAHTLQELASHAQKNLPRYAVPLFLRVFKDEQASNRTGTNKQQKHMLREQGVEPSKVTENGDMLFWLAPGESTYRQFGEAEYKMLSAGQVKL
ncbi:acetyl-CoA synthetase-like protein, partial [Microthyrium microscopicum]